MADNKLRVIQTERVKGNTSLINCGEESLIIHNSSSGHGVYLGNGTSNPIPIANVRNGDSLSVYSLSVGGESRFSGMAHFDGNIHLCNYGDNIGGRIYFGDSVDMDENSANVYIGEDEDDALTMYAYQGVKIIAETDDGLYLNGARVITEHNITDFNVGSASKLYTARKLWGQSFDGTADVSGDITATAYYTSSDERLKTFGDDIEVDFEKLAKLRKSYFNFNDDPDKQHLGVSAQEVKEIYPEIVNTDDNGYLSVDYAKLSVVALKAVDNLHERITRLEKLLIDKE